MQAVCTNRCRAGRSLSWPFDEMCQSIHKNSGVRVDSGTFTNQAVNARHDNDERHATRCALQAVDELLIMIRQSPEPSARLFLLVQRSADPIQQPWSSPSADDLHALLKARGNLSVEVSRIDADCSEAPGLLTLRMLSVSST